MADLKGTPATQLEGGFINIRPKVFRGVIRHRDDHRILWTCKHNHYRPEYNARYSQDTDQVWETSGLNCGRAAYRQLLEGEKVKGDPGLVGDPHFPIELRDDVRFARVGREEFLGRVTLRSNGHRVLTVSHSASTLTGTVNLDVPPSKGVTVNTTNTNLLRTWATAAWLLKGGVWGMVFQDPRVRMNAEGPIDRAVEELLEADGKPGPKKLPVPERRKRIVIPEQSRTDEDRPSTDAVRKRSGRTRGRSSEKLVDILPSASGPHVRAARNDAGKRVYEVIGHDGEVLDRFVHRGRATAALSKVKGETP